jgi:predicted CopG family antitoxin
MTTNIKVSRKVHEELKSRKQEGDTFDDVLKNLLGLRPSLEDCIAYLDEDLQEASRQIVEAIESSGDLKKEVRRAGVHKDLTFSSKSSGNKIAKCRFSEHDLKLFYKGLNGDMKSLGYLSKSENAIKVQEADNVSEISKKLKNKVDSAIEKWG